MPQVVFKDPQLEREFNDKGYVKLPFLSPAQTAYFKEQFFNTIAQSGGPKGADLADFAVSGEISYDFTFIDNNVDYKRLVFDLITKEFTPIANQYLNNYTPIIANYIRKKTGGGEVPMHQNWAFVDEERYTSVSVWVPLVDSNPENGTLQMVDGSHKRFGKHRGPMVPWELQNLKDEIVAHHLSPMHLKAGEAVILDDSIVHYSGINTTPGLRLAIQLILIPADAMALHYHLDPDTDKHSIRVLEADVDFFMNFHPWLKPTGRRELKTLPFEQKEFTYAEFLNGLSGPRFDALPPVGDTCIPPLFTDATLQQHFDEAGFVKVPLLNAEQVNSLLAYYHSLSQHPVGQYGFHVSLDSKDSNYIDAVFAKLFEVILPALHPLLNDYKAFTASYVVKEAGLQNSVPPHQDWTFVNEEHFCSATVWIPLMDVNKNNGALGVIRGSHKLFNFPRISPSPQVKSVISEHIFELFPYVEVIEMKAGEALIFNNKLIHASPPNVSDKTRIGAGIGITQKAAQLLHYYKIPTNDTDVALYEVDETFFKQYSNGVLGSLFNKGEEPGTLKKSKILPKPGVVYGREEILKMVRQLPGVTHSEVAARHTSTSDNTKNDAAVETTPAALAATSEILHATNTLAPEVYTDTRSFFEKYTPGNIVAELKYRLSQLTKN